MEERGTAYILYSVIWGKCKMKINCGALVLQFCLHFPYHTNIKDHSDNYVQSQVMHASHDLNYIKRETLG